MVYKIHFFAKSNDGICGSDFAKPLQQALINLSFVLSLSDLINFELPMSGKFVSKFAILTMSNNDKYYVNEKTYEGLCYAINEHHALNATN